MRIAAALAFLAAASFTTASQAQWSREIVKDRMTGEDAYTQFTARSSNSLDLPAPYQGVNHGTLIQRIGKIQGGVQLTIAIDKGQFICMPGSCTVRLKAGNGQPRTVRAAFPADQSRNALVMQEIIEPSAEEILVEALVYQAGVQLLTFSTPGGIGSASKP
jgi:hypothetical protein